LAAVTARIEPREERRADAADVQRARGTRRETGAYRRRIHTDIDCVGTPELYASDLPIVASGMSSRC